MAAILRLNSAQPAVRKHIAHPFTPVPAALVKSGAFTLQVIGLYTILLSFRFAETNECAPAHSTLCELAGISRRTLIRHLQTLRTAGVLQWEKRDGSSNQYYFPEVKNIPKSEPKTAPKQAKNQERGCVTHDTPHMSPMAQRVCHPWHTNYMSLTRCSPVCKTAPPHVDADGNGEKSVTEKPTETARASGSKQNSMENQYALRITTPEQQEQDTRKFLAASHLPETLTAVVMLWMDIHTGQFPNRYDSGMLHRLVAEYGEAAVIRGIETMGDKGLKAMHRLKEILAGRDPALTRDTATGSPLTAHPIAQSAYYQLSGPDKALYREVRKITDDTGPMWLAKGAQLPPGYREVV